MRSFRTSSFFQETDRLQISDDFIPFVVEILATASTPATQLKPYALDQIHVIEDDNDEDVVDDDDDSGIICGPKANLKLNLTATALSGLSFHSASSFLPLLIFFYMKIDRVAQSSAPCSTPPFIQRILGKGCDFSRHLHSPLMFLLLPFF
jgi:hypothetical protein